MTKEQTPPLVSDEQIDGIDHTPFPRFQDALKHLRSIYETSRKKDAAKIAHLESLNEQKYNEGFTEASRIHGVQIARLDGLVQELVDDLSRAYCIDKPSLDLAKSLGIEPKTTT